MILHGFAWRNSKNIFFLLKPQYLTKNPKNTQKNQKNNLKINENTGFRPPAATAGDRRRPPPTARPTAQPTARYPRRRHLGKFKLFSDCSIFFKCKWFKIVYQTQKPKYNTRNLIINLKPSNDTKTLKIPKSSGLYSLVIMGKSKNEKN